MAERNSAFHYKNGSYNAAEPADDPNKKVDRSEKPERKSQIALRHNEVKSGTIVSIVLIAFLAASILGAVIYYFDKRNTVYNDIVSLKNELTLAEAENVRLQSELESRMTAKNVEDYAENVLGMKKIDSSQIEYIKIQTDDVVNIPEPEETIISKIKGFFDKCVEYFRG